MKSLMVVLLISLSVFLIEPVLDQVNLAKSSFVNKNSTQCCVENDALLNCQSNKTGASLPDVPSSKGNDSCVCQCPFCLNSNSLVAFSLPIFQLQNNPVLSKILFYQNNKLLGITHEPATPPPKTLS